ncbi:hypothetical protein MTO96_032873 [Rhipicephalus appendiculatus]
MRHHHLPTLPSSQPVLGGRQTRTVPSHYPQRRTFGAGPAETSALLALLADILCGGRGPGLPELPRPTIPCHQTGPLPQTGKEILLTPEVPLVPLIGRRHRQDPQWGTLISRKRLLEEQRNDGLCRRILSHLADLNAQPSDESYPGTPSFTGVLPPVQLTISPPGTGLQQFVALVTRHREAVSARSPHGLSLIARTIPWPGNPAYLASYSLAL